MKLWHSPTSPYVRKVMMAAIELGLAERIECVPARTPESKIAEANPLDKIPTLETDDGQILYDSIVICEYLDSLTDKASLFPASGPERWKTLRMHTLADGLIDAAVLRVHETRRPEEQRNAAWDERQKTKIVDGLARLEEEIAALDGPVDIVQITTACLLGFLDRRFADDDWRADHPALAAWQAKFTTRPSAAGTEPPPL
ncbi:MAG: glutathione S-transferase N-terminal domain-containing protein [Proteobacteria bacterium]|nr:glutathione S-transferase N-terminal domain-containing protein [Pseudomonadota bacterium]